MSAALSSRRAYDWRTFWVLMAAGMLGLVALLPYALELQGPRLRALPLPLVPLLIIQMVQNGILLALAVGIGLWAGGQLGLGPQLLPSWMRGQPAQPAASRTLVGAVLAGLCVGMVVVVLDAALFVRMGVVPTGGGQSALPVSWRRLLASLYGGITEELFMRLGLFSVLAWFLTRIRRQARHPATPGLFWVTNLIVALLFGLGHLPATAAILPLSLAVVLRAILLNGVASLLFGHLYWTRGLETAITSHLAADVVLAVAPRWVA